MMENPSVWVALGFVIFVALAFKPAKKVLLGALDQRADQIAKQLAEATALRKEAEELLAENQKRQQQAVAEAAKIIEAARTQAETLKVQAAADIEAMVARRQQAAMEKIAQAETVALAQVRSAAVEAAVAATASLLTEKVQGDVAARLLDEAIADLPSRLN